MPPVQWILRRLILPLLCLTTFGSAEAACAFILWKVTSSKDPLLSPVEKGPNVGDWTFERTTESLKECEAESFRRVATAVEILKLKYPSEDGYVVGEWSWGGYFVVLRDDAGKGPLARRHVPISVQFKCFPDTIDPRRPKVN
jgi:hypothetical protein